MLMAGIPEGWAPPSSKHFLPWTFRTPWARIPPLGSDSSSASWQPSPVPPHPAVLNGRCAWGLSAWTAPLCRLPTPSPVLPLETPFIG